VTIVPGRFILTTPVLDPGAHAHFNETHMSFQRRPGILRQDREIQTQRALSTTPHKMPCQSPPRVLPVAISDINSQYPKPVREKD
jgi:hypothetical protein